MRSNRLIISMYFFIQNLIYANLDKNLIYANLEKKILSVKKKVHLEMVKGRHLLTMAGHDHSCSCALQSLASQSLQVNIMILVEGLNESYICGSRKWISTVVSGLLLWMGMQRE